MFQFCLNDYPIIEKHEKINFYIKDKPKKKNKPNENKKDSKKLNCKKIKIARTILDKFLQTNVIATLYSKAP